MNGNNTSTVTHSDYMNGIKFLLYLFMFGSFIFVATQVSVWLAGITLIAVLLLVIILIVALANLED